MDCVAVVVAAGRGQRAGGDVPKQYAELAGKPIIRRAAEALAGHPGIDAVRCIVHPDDRSLYEAAAAGLDLLPPVPGGATRQESVRLGLESLASLAPRNVLVHDAARPFPSPRLLDALLAALADGEAAVPALPVTDTLKRVEDGRIVATVARDGLWRVQTPQAFRYGPLLEAHRSARGLELTDDAAVAERSGMTVAVVPGDESNMKVTTPADFERARALAEGGPAVVRVGFGFDVHRFGEGDRVTLCGVQIPHGHGLVGHSDADVGLHALTDALFGAAAAGDIGTHFPPSDPRWRGADSAVFLRHAAAIVRERGGRILHVDVTLVCEEPRLAPHRERMSARIAELLGLPLGAVGLKATTTEGLGFTGRREGIAAHAVATVAMPAG